jgi:hypothetical protein
MEMKAQLR